MNSPENIKRQIEKLFHSNPEIHVNIRMSRPKVNLENDPAVIKGVYPHFFMIEENSSGFSRTHSVRYTEVGTNHIEIVELIKKV